MSIEPVLGNGSISGKAGVMENIVARVQRKDQENLPTLAIKKLLRLGSLVSP